MECREKTNATQCNCSYPGCANHGICCQCIANHRSHGELPACYFPSDVERTYDRSIKRFVALQKK